jgi:excisionase family DNA binding protein
MSKPEDTEALLSTREAAEMLGIVERTVLLHLARGELKGHRTGRRWRVSRASVEAHPNFRASSPTPTRRSRVDDAPTAPTSPRAELSIALPPKRPRREWTFRNLRVLTDLTTLAARIATALAGLTQVPSVVTELALRSGLEAARHGAAGFHAFIKQEKVRLYSRAREHAAMAAASLWIVADLAHDRAEGLRLMAREYEEMAPGLGALMRTSSSADA